MSDMTTDLLAAAARRLLETPPDQPLLLADRMNDLSVSLAEYEQGRYVQIGPRDYLALDPLDFGPGPEWMTPHEPEPEVRRYAVGGLGIQAVTKPCWCPLPADHPLHGPPPGQRGRRKKETNRG